MRMRLRIFTLLLTIVAGGPGAYAQRSRVPDHNFYFELTGHGTATGPDSPTADSAAFIEAQYNAISMCSGYSYNIMTTSNLCNSADDGNGNTLFSCSVSVSLTCWVVVR
jgi:hypothetical protein